ncbi:MAG: cation diffusion facilitator family transporter [Hahellaceae bacterium]|nr:cation diffusion facilitator family transporter [Hahellaceae bacterium]
MSHGADSVKSILYALGANFAIAVAKLMAAMVTGSGSMMAESIHSLADCGNQGLLLFGLKHAKKPPTPEHPLGFGKSIYFWSFIVALMLFSMGGLFSIYEGVHKLRAPEPMTYPWVAVAVLIFSVIAEGASLKGCIAEVNKERAGRSFYRWFRETRQSELLVIFGEDLAALLGLSLALVAVLAAIITGNPVYDAWGSIAIGGLLVVIAFFVGIEVKALLIGQGVEPTLKVKMELFLLEQPEVKRLFNLVSLQMGQDAMVAVKAEMAPQPSDRALVEAINAVEARFKGQFPMVVWLFFEPDIKD